MEPFWLISLEKAKVPPDQKESGRTWVLCACLTIEFLRDRFVPHSSLNPLSFALQSYGNICVNSSDRTLHSLLDSGGEMREHAFLGSAPLSRYHAREIRSISNISTKAVAKGSPCFLPLLTCRFMETRGGLVLGRFCWGKMKLALQGRIEGAVQRLLEAGTGWNWLELAGTGWGWLPRLR